MPCLAPPDPAPYLEAAAWAGAWRGAETSLRGAGLEVAGGLRFAWCEQDRPAYLDVGLIVEASGWSNPHGATMLGGGGGLEVEAGIGVLDGGTLGGRLAVALSPRSSAAFPDYNDAGGAATILAGPRFRAGDLKLGLDAFVSPPTGGSTDFNYGVIGSLGITHARGAVASAVLLGLGALALGFVYVEVNGRND